MARTTASAWRCLTATAIAPSSIRAKYPASSPTMKCSSIRAPPWPFSPIRTRSAPPAVIARLVAPLVAGYPLSPAEQQALDIYHGLQQGRIDRSLLAPNLSDYFTPEAIADFQSSLAPLGEPLEVRQTQTELRGGMTFRSFSIVFPAATFASPPTPTPTANWSNTSSRPPSRFKLRTHDLGVNPGLAG